MKKELTRLEAIQELLKQELLSDQEQIVTLLKKRYGLETNQAAVSRDLRKLGVVKKEIRGSLIYELPEKDVKMELLKLGVLDIVHNEVLILIKTHPGLAAFVGDFLDQQEPLEVMGCIAGENVVFVAPKSIKKIQKTYQAICLALQFKKGKTDV